MLSGAEQILDSVVVKANTLINSLVEKATMEDADVYIRVLNVNYDI